MDLGYPIHSVSLSSGGSSGPGLALISDGEITDPTVLGFLGRSMDPGSKDDNCLKCLAQNEAVNYLQTDEELWAGSSLSNFKFNVFCEKEDLSASRCCEASYNSEGVLRFYGDSSSDEICTLGLCSLSELESQKPLIGDYFQMYQKCVRIHDRFQLGGDSDFTQFKGQGQQDLPCKTSAVLSMSKTSPAQYDILWEAEDGQGTQAEHDGQLHSADSRSPESLCLFDITTESPDSMGYF